jgi:hypothetical protein
MKNGLEIDQYGNKRYWKNNLLHREDGPAIEYFDGEKHWFLNDEGIICKTNEEFLRIVKYKWLI